MKPIIFRQINRKVGLIAALVYLVMAFGLLFGLVGFGKVVNFVNSMGESSGGTKALGLAVGIAFVVPVFFIARLVYPKLEVSIEGQNLIINKNGSPLHQININSIASMAMNKPNINSLNLYSQDGGLIFGFQPFANNTALPTLVKAISGVKKFKATQGQKSIFGGKVTTTDYHQ
ncbi:hypothetical protein VRU48_18275 [Pedobacter sp. KR3-3]|uniref:Uncharacterized protein n=1 Tax=Pedobacter albus TaxID=3113905 RepID=A0ABU7IC66_9SPHI|nr:hypothetical protein [Pedobacter sp. KR3-3]MEE1947078.1 hypothetical protein [Pedobacter sp. KR3-3]